MSSLWYSHSSSENAIQNLVQKFHKADMPAKINQPCYKVSFVFTFPEMYQVFNLLLPLYAFFGLVSIAFLIKLLTLKKPHANVPFKARSIQNKQQNPLTVCSPHACNAFETVLKYIFVTLILAKQFMYK